MRNADADIAISVNWLTIIRQEAIESFRFGILNAHCGDLPRYRGNATPNWAVLNGENSYAISVHYMLPGELDAGNILIKKVYPMTERTTVTDIYENLSAEIPKLFCEALEKVENGGAVGSNQSKNVQDSLRCYPRIPTDSFIDFNMSRKHIIREVRASAHPFQGAFFYWNNLKIYVFEAEEEPFVSPSCVYPGQVIAVKKAGGEVWVAAKDGIIVLRRIYINNIEYDASEILKSTRIRLNYCLPEEIYQLKIQLAGLNDQVRKMQKIIEEHGFEI